jgi:YHS domain-containing protein
MKTTFALMSLLALAACEEKKTPPAPVPAAAAVPAPTAAAPAAAATIPVGTATKCPVSGEAFTVDAKTVQLVHEGKSYALCCADCVPEFKKDPAKYAKK